MNVVDRFVKYSDNQSSLSQLITGKTGSWLVSRMIFNKQKRLQESSLVLILNLANDERIPVPCLKIKRLPLELGPASRFLY